MLDTSRPRITPWKSYIGETGARRVKVGEDAGSPRASPSSGSVLLFGNGLLLANPTLKARFAWDRICPEFVSLYRKRRDLPEYALLREHLLRKGVDIDGIDLGGPDGPGTPGHGGVPCFDLENLFSLFEEFDCLEAGVETDPMSEPMSRMHARIRRAFKYALLRVHPERRVLADVCPAEWDALREFLSRYDSWFTVNYDLCLHTLHHEIHPGAPLDGFTDGFVCHVQGARAEEGEKAGSRRARFEADTRSRLHYLHGCLAFEKGQDGAVTRRDTDAFFEKVEAVRTLDARTWTEFDAFDDTLFVSSATGYGKDFEIRSEPGYLARAFRELESAVRAADDILVYGMAFEHDVHILRMLLRKEPPARVSFTARSEKDFHCLLHLVHRVHGGIPENLVIVDTSEVDSWRALG